MSTATATPTRPPASKPKKVNQARVLLSEWTKIRSLRSTSFSLLAAVVFIIGFSVLVPWVIVAHWPPRDPREALGFDPTTRALSGIFLAQLAIGVLGVLLITGEYATGMIRATFAAVPARLPVLWAKAAVFAAVTLVLMVPTVLGAFLIGQSILTSKHLQTSLSSSGVLRAVIGAALFLTVSGCWGSVSGHCCATLPAASRPCSACSSSCRSSCGSCRRPGRTRSTSTCRAMRGRPSLTCTRTLHCWHRGPGWGSSSATQSSCSLPPRSVCAGATPDCGSGCSRTPGLRARPG